MTGRARSPEFVRTLLASGALLSSIGLLTAVGLLTGASPLIGLAAAGVILIVGTSFVNLAVLPVLAFAVIIVVQRVGGESGNLSLSDLMLFVAVFPAILMLLPARTDVHLRRILWLSLVYQAALLFTVIANPYTANIVEWAHEFLLVAGAVVVGYAAGISGHGRLALKLFMISCLVIAGLTLYTGLTQFAAGNWGPVYVLWPYYMQKNYIGCVLAFAAVVAYAQPDILGWRKSGFWAYFLIMLVSVLAAQSKQALVSIVIGVLVIILRPIPTQVGQPPRRRSKAILLPLLPIAIFVYSVTRGQLTSGNQFSAANQRITWYGDAWQIFSSSPWYGVGLRYWYTGNYPAFQPPNAELEVLASAGIIGLAGFLIMFAGICWVLWKLPAAIGTLPFSLVLMRFVQGQLDLFWVAVQVSVPFAIAGLLMGHAQYLRTRADQHPESVAARVEPFVTAGPKR